MNNRLASNDALPKETLEEKVARWNFELRTDPNRRKDIQWFILNDQPKLEFIR
jgi:hypothetical protein